ncbi:hypothetical protein C6P40_004796 [Pichia californica]|uniref:Uncharacterized protein n=1 Tax=Pichia californica TaxID=460514 RepID=A0A9P6WM84_9ASCO|nr:hypothetical protein C6P42_004222 [[Candida] californica]KAG0689590.1 hypothetical protein C6P40_004796 [[Candida] californica]
MEVKLSDFALLAILLLQCTLIYHYYKKNQKLSVKPKTKNDKFPTPVIKPVSNDFKWEKTEPKKYRPFKKGQYNMTLAIKKLDVNEYICIENTYLDMVHLRERLFDEMKFYGCDDSAVDALKEMYCWVFDYMHTKYPRYFQIDKEKELYLNKITNKFFPTDPNNLKKEEILRLLCTNIEEDFLIMIKNPNSEQPDEYILRSAVTCFAAGFNPLTKLNKNLTAVHEPVPNYTNKLQLSMNRFFDRVHKNEFIVRTNWSVQTHCNLCAPSGSHARKTDSKATLAPINAEDLDFNKCFMRCEKQCVTRLPKTGAIMMIVRTYPTSLMKLRMELSPEERETFCSAIDGVSGDLAIYKRRVVWGDAVKKFMNFETDGKESKYTEYKFQS